MRRLMNFLGQFLWGIVWVLALLAGGLFIIHVIRAHVGGPVGAAAAAVEGAVTPTGAGGGS